MGPKIVSITIHKRPVPFVQALQQFKPNYYDLVILNIKMPRLDGFAICEKIREIDKAVQIVFITPGEAYYENFRNYSYK